MSEYLEHSFTQARDKLLAGERKTMTFSKKEALAGEPDIFNMKFEHDVAGERAQIEELLQLKTAVTKVKQGI